MRLLLLSAMLAFAADQEKPPQVDKEKLIRFWKRNAELNQLQADQKEISLKITAANNDISVIVGEMQKDCTGKWELWQDPKTGEIQCRAKVEEKKKD